MSENEEVTKHTDEDIQKFADAAHSIGMDGFGDAFRNSYVASDTTDEKFNQLVKNLETAIAQFESYFEDIMEEHDLEYS